MISGLVPGFLVCLDSVSSLIIFLKHSDHQLLVRNFKHLLSSVPSFQRPNVVWFRFTSCRRPIADTLSRPKSQTKQIKTQTKKQKPKFNFNPTIIPIIFIIKSSPLQEFFQKKIPNTKW